MVAHVTTSDPLSTHVTVVMSLQDKTVKQPSTTVNSSVQTVTMEVVWMMLEHSSVSVILDSLENCVMWKSMNV